MSLYNTNTEADKSPLISVIIPLYNTEKYIKRCIESIESQSFRNLEIIVVDDGSKDNSVSIVKKLSNRYKNINLISHAKNLGLFQTRITGLKASACDYIAFIDADDYVSIDWFRLLYERITKENADIAIGPTLRDQEGKEKLYFNLDPLRQPISLKGQEVLDNFIRQQGSMYSWHVIWNKLYSKKIWSDALTDLEAHAKAYPDFTMCEDVAFSAALWCRAKKVCNFTFGAEYYYFQHKKQCTKFEKDKKSNLKKINDVAAAFQFMKAQLEGANAFDKYESDFTEWKKRYAQIYFNELNKIDCSFYRNILSSAFGLDCKEFEKLSDNHDYFYSITTRQSENLIQERDFIKKLICSDKIKVVSFDIFDTLILRPFFYPTDLFFLLNEKFNELAKTKTFIYFNEMRVEAEKACRKKNNHSEDITLSEIYDQLKSDYLFDGDVLDEICIEETCLEEKFCFAREYGKQLYDLAKQQGKTVIISSDMYLPRKTIENILRKNGYEYDKLYLSGDLKLTKATGNLYGFIEKEYDLPAAAFLHVGDNYESDVRNAQNAGWNAGFLPKCADLFQGRGKEPFSRNQLFASLMKSGTMRDYNYAKDVFLGTRCALALTANKFFDYPYVQFNPESQYNIDPYNLGYFAVGQYLYAVTDWIIKTVKAEKRKKVHFVARDGYLPMCAYNILQPYDETLPSSDYLYVSRKSMAFSDIYGAVDLYSLIHKLNIYRYSPKSLIQFFSQFYTKPSDKDEIEQKLKFTPKKFAAAFQSLTDYQKTIQAIGETIDYQKVAEYKNNLKSYFSKIISPNDIMFDIGYSGRVEASLTELLGFPADSLYIHTNSEILNVRTSKHGFQTKLFYDYKPAITGVMREHVFMKLAPSTVGYVKDGEDIKPVFEEYKPDFATVCITETLQKAALDFVKDMVKFFGGYLNNLYYRKDDFAFAFEHYLHYSKPIDRELFRCVRFEDDFGLGKTVCAVDFWNSDIAYFELNKNAPRNTRDTRLWKMAYRIFPAGTMRGKFARKVYRKIHKSAD